MIALAMRSGRVTSVHASLVRDIASAIDATADGAFDPSGRLVDRAVDIRVHVLDEDVARAVQRDADGAAPLEAVLRAVQILEHDVHALDAGLKVTQRSSELLPRVAIDVLTVIQVKATDIKPHGNTSVVRNESRPERAKQTRHPHHSAASPCAKAKLAKPIMPVQ